MCMAMLEWFLFLAAFLYCLAKVFAKADHWSMKVLATMIGTLFALLRYGYCFS